MYHAPKCPNCGGEIHVDDMYDVDHEDEYCVLSYVGTCEQCQHSVQWEAYYPFGHFYDIELC